MFPLNSGSLLNIPLILTTKLYIPRLNQNHIPRHQLIKALNLEANKNLVLICAPAGFGKTSLLSEWAVQSTSSVGWVSLDEKDNDPVSFWSYFIVAFQTIKPELGDNMQAVFQNLGPLNIEPFLAAFINVIATEVLPFSIILDDYHVISNIEIHKGLNYLLQNAPPQFSIILASRKIPPFNISHLRSKNILAEIQTEELSFSTDETIEFFRKSINFKLTDLEISLIMRKTEGWAAGLHILALSLKNQTDPHKFVINFSGSSRFISDFLSEEVFTRQPEKIQTFLVQTALFDRINSNLAAAVLDISSLKAQNVLEKLEQSNLFINSLDDKKDWYQYHPLFSEFLQNKLRQSHSEIIPNLYHKASIWFEKNGWIEDTIQTSIKGQEFERAVELIENYYNTMIARGNTHTLLDWIENLPSEVIQCHAILYLVQAWALVPTTRFEEVQKFLNYAKEILSRTGPPKRRKIESILGEIATIETLVATFQYHPKEIIILSNQALSIIPKEDTFFQGLINLCLGVAQFLSGNLEESHIAFSLSLKLQSEEGNRLLIFLSKYYLAEIASLEGQLHFAADLLVEALQITKVGGNFEIPLAGIAHISLAKLYYEWNQIEEAAKQANLGLQLCRNWWITDSVVEAYLILARIEQARGDSAKALNLYRQTLILKDWKPNAPFITHIAIKSLKFWITAGLEDKIINWIQYQVLPTLPPLLGENIDKELIEKLIVCVPFLIAQEKWTQVRPLLETSLHYHETHGYIRCVIEDLVLKALMDYSLGDHDKAFISIKRALLLSEKEGFVRVFIDEGEQMVSLLMEAQAREIVPDYLNLLIQAAVKEKHLELISESNQMDKLSEREIQVLSLIAIGSTPKQIAGLLFLTIGTIRNHLKNIYSKLEVHSRIEAINRAKDLNIFK